jgi:hypothetical protein
MFYVLTEAIPSRDMVLGFFSKVGNASPRIAMYLHVELVHAGEKVV